MTNRVGINKAITVRSVNGPEVTIIQGQGPNGTTAIRCAWVGGNSILSGFTLTNGATKTSGDLYDDQAGGGANMAGEENSPTACSPATPRTTPAAGRSTASR